MAEGTTKQDLKKKKITLQIECAGPFSIIEGHSSGVTSVSTSFHPLIICQQSFLKKTRLHFFLLKQEPLPLIKKENQEYLKDCRDTGCTLNTPMLGVGEYKKKQGRSF